MKAYKHLTKFALAMNLVVSVDDGDGISLPKCDSFNMIIAEIEGVEEAEFMIYDPHTGNRLAWALIIPHGMDDDETVADYTDNALMRAWSASYEASQKVAA